MVRWWSNERELASWPMTSRLHLRHIAVVAAVPAGDLGIRFRWRDTPHLCPAFTHEIYSPRPPPASNDLHRQPQAHVRDAFSSEGVLVGAMVGTTKAGSFRACTCCGTGIARRRRRL